MFKWLQKLLILTAKHENYMCFRNRGMIGKGKFYIDYKKYVAREEKHKSRARDGLKNFMGINSLYFTALCYLQY